MGSAPDRGGPGDRPPRAFAATNPAPYQLQAAINAVHADASTIEETDWSQIVALYDQLLAVSPTPVVALNRAIAIGEVQGAGCRAGAGGRVGAGHLPPVPRHASRSPSAAGPGRRGRGRLRRAADMAPTDAERDFLRLGGRASR